MDDKKQKPKDQSDDGEMVQEPEIDAVGQELEQLKGLATQLEGNYKRALADYQNLQRRTQAEKAEWIRMASRDLVLKLLPILDTLMLAEKHTQDKNFALTVSQFLQALEQEGVTRIKTTDEEFDPQTMEAVTTAEGKTGKVIEEIRAGFMYYDSVLRAAQVVVGK